MKSKKTNINQKFVHIDQKLLKNVKKSQNKAKKDDILQKKQKITFTEEELCDVADMFFRCEMQVARLASLLGLFFAEKVDKYRLLKEYMATDRYMFDFSNDCHRKIAKMTGITAELVNADKK